MMFQALTTAFAAVMLAALSTAAEDCPGYEDIIDRAVFCRILETGYMANCLGTFFAVPLETCPSIQLDQTFFGNMTQLKNITLTDFCISQLDAPTYFPFPGWTNLALVNTGVQQLPENLMALAHNVTRFRMRICNVTSLAENLFEHNPTLAIVDLSNNQLTTLPTSLFAWNDRLDSVYLNHNCLTSLPGEVFSLCPELKYVSLSHNKLTALPADIFAGNPQLIQVELSGNALTSLPDDLFYRNPELKYVFLDRNRLTELPSGIFNTNQELSEVHISENNLTSLPSGLFDWNFRLYFVDLNNNSLTWLPEGIFRQNPRLKFVFLSNNSLTFVSSETFNRNYNYMYSGLSLMGNPLSCDCHFKGQVTQLSQKKWIVFLPPDCETKMNVSCSTGGDAQSSLYIGVIGWSITWHVMKDLLPKW